MMGKKIKTELSPEEIVELFECDLETEPHSVWGILGDYNSTRVGLHIYKTKNGLRGYYESGERPRRDGLLKIKTWFRLKIHQENNHSIVSTRVLYNPYLILLFLGVFYLLLQSIITMAWGRLIALAIMPFPIMFIFANSSFNEEDIIFKEIERRLGVINERE